MKNTIEFQYLKTGQRFHFYVHGKKFEAIKRSEFHYVVPEYGIENNTMNPCEKVYLSQPTFSELEIDQWGVLKTPSGECIIRKVGPFTARMYARNGKLLMRTVYVTIDHPNEEKMYHVSDEMKIKLNN